MAYRPLGAPASLPAFTLNSSGPVRSDLARASPRRLATLAGARETTPRVSRASAGVFASTRELTIVPPGSTQRLEASPVVAPGSRRVAPASRLVAKTSRLVEMRSPVVAEGSRVVAERPANESSTVSCCMASALCGFASSLGVAEQPADRRLTAPVVAQTSAGVAKGPASAFWAPARVAERLPARATRPAAPPAASSGRSLCCRAPACVAWIRSVSCCKRLQRKAVFQGNHLPSPRGPAGGFSGMPPRPERLWYLESEQPVLYRSRPMQQRPLAALLLLAAFGLGLLAGAHPCGARPAGEEHHQRSSCHEGMAKGHGASVLPSAPPQDEGPSSCCDTFCQHACHMTAVAAALPVAFAIAPVARAVTEAYDPGLALFVHPIDHIPLA